MRNTLIIILFSILFVSVFFFWNESFSLSQKINDQKFGNFFSVIGAFATATSIFLLYRQVKEMQEDRKASNKPDLYPETTYYDILLLESFHDRELHDILLKRTTQEDGENFENHINIFNIGLGTAKEIEFEWLFNKSEIENLIKGKYYYNDNEIAKNQHINFLLANNKVPIDPPYFYLKCCGIDFNKKEIPTRELADVTKSDKPKLQLKITYKDIYNHLISKSFDVIIHAHFHNATLMFREMK
jgi:hypothetical protein